VQERSARGSDESMIEYRPRSPVAVRSGRYRRPMGKLPETSPAARCLTKRVACLSASGRSPMRAAVQVSGKTRRDHITKDCHASIEKTNDITRNFIESFQVNKSSSTCASTRCWRQITPLSEQELCTSARFFHGSLAQDDSDPAAPSVSPRRLAWLMRFNRTSCLGGAPDTVVNTERRRKGLCCQGG
jgi:hypothetical protein